MTGRGDDEVASNLDLATLLWGDLAPPSPSPEDTMLAAALAELPPPDASSLAATTRAIGSIGGERHGPRSERQPTAPERSRGAAATLPAPPCPDDRDAPLDLDPEDLLIELPDLESVPLFEDDESDEPDDFVDDAAAAALTEQCERPLGVAALTERLQREILPRLNGYVAARGYLTLGHLGYAVAALQGSPVHLAQVRAFVERAGVPLFPSRAHHGARGIPLEVYEETRRRFGDLVHGEPDEALVVARLGYAGVPLNAGTRHFLVQAWLGHCLSRAEERAHAETIAAEIARSGPDHRAWSAAARVAREALIVDNLWLVSRVARKYVGRGLEVDDLLQIGVLGLCRAVAKFDVTRGYRFVTFASAWVRQSIARHVGDQGRLIRLPIHVHEHERRVKDTAEQLWDAYGREPTPEEVAAACGDVTVATAQALLVTSRPVSLDAPRLRAWIEHHASLTEAEDLEEMAARHDLARIEMELLGRLSERERHRLDHRLGLYGGDIHTLEAIGKELGITRERIRQLEEKALKKLRQPFDLRRLQDFTGHIAPAPAPEVPRIAIAAVLPHFKPHDRRLLSDVFGLGDAPGTATETVAQTWHAAPWYVRGLERRARLMAHDYLNRLGSNLRQSDQADATVRAAEARRAEREALLRSALNAALARLTPSNRRLLETRYGLDGGPHRTIKETAALCRVSTKAVDGAQKALFDALPTDLRLEIADLLTLSPQRPKASQPDASLRPPRANLQAVH